jgi:hypothetical protein
MSYVMVAVGASGVISAWGQGQAAKGQAAAQGILADAQAKIEEDAGIEMAKLIRKAGRHAIGASTAGYAAAGVKVGDGSAADVRDEQIVDVQHDAAQAILEGKYRGIGLRTNAAMNMNAARGAANAGVASAIGNAAMYGYTGYKGWKTAQPTDMSMPGNEGRPNRGGL